MISSQATCECETLARPRRPLEAPAIVQHSQSRERVVRRQTDRDPPVWTPFHAVFHGIADQFVSAAADYFPSRDTELLEYMELLAVFEASSRRLLPPKYANITPEELDARLRHLRAIIGSRR